MISSLKLSNWRTHENTELEFSQGVNALLGVMGAGKTSILEAICFALFGTFPALQQRRIKLDNVIMRSPQKKNDAEIELSFNVDGDSYSVLRRIEKGKGTTYSKLSHNGELLEAPNTQRVTEIIEKILKIDYELFSEIIYSEQNRLDYFLTIRKGERTKRVDELLKIYRFENARANTVTLINRLKEKRKMRREDYIRAEQQLKDVDVSALREEIEKARLELSEILQSIKDFQGKEEELSKSVGELRSKKIVYRKLEEQRLNLSLRIGHISKEVSGYEDKTKKYTVASVESKLSDLNERLNIQQQTEIRIAELRQLSSSLARQIKELEQKSSRLGEKKERLKALEETKKEIKTLEEKYGDASKSITSLRTKLEEESKALVELTKAESYCPTCETKLSAEKKENIITKKKANAKDIEEQLLSKEKDLSSLEQRLSSLRERHEELLGFASVLEEIKELEKEKCLLEKEKEMVEQKLKAKEKEYSVEIKAEISNEIKQFEKIKDVFLILENKAKLEIELKDVEEKIKEIDFKEEILETEEQALNLVDKKLNVSLEKQIFISSILKEKTSRLKNLEAQAALVGQYKEEVELLERLDNELGTFRQILERTQVSLREQFIDSINYLMREIWQTLYPYADYNDIRLAIEDDYVLELKTPDGAWVNVEGQVSGGERMTAALTLRLALALLLAPNLKWLILDEPTHNLDQAAVEELASCLREKISSIVEQVFLITHDESLAEAVTGKLYKLERGEGKKEVTKIVAS